MAETAPSKVRPTHLKRDAFLYVRQSTLHQLVHNTESTQRQYALSQRAVALGWSLDQIHVIDCDLGQSGASAADRAGFQQLVTEVSLGQAGIVLGLEVSRLARNSTDWHRLLELCALSDTLILDEDGLYDCNDFNDRLLLGLKGTLSEAELHFLRARLRGGSEEELAALALPRLARLLEHGVTCAEVKSGYGLSLADELKMLRVVQRLARLQPVELVPTLLCAHAVPEEHRAHRERYVELCASEIVPAVAQAHLARFCDAFVEEGAFTAAEGRRILEAGKRHGLVPRLHVDQLTASGGAELAAELGAATADHLEHVSEAGIAALARAGVSAVLIPTSTLFLRQRPYAPGRRLWDAGVNVALGTNLNPGSAMSESVPLALSLACLENGLTAAEAYWAATRGAALALGRAELGRLEVGGPADLVIFGCASYRHLPYHLGVNHARTVIRAGRVVSRSQALHTPLCA